MYIDVRRDTVQLTGRSTYDIIRITLHREILTQMLRLVNIGFTSVQGRLFAFTSAKRRLAPMREFTPSNFAKLGPETITNLTRRETLLKRIRLRIRRYYACGLEKVGRFW